MMVINQGKWNSLGDLIKLLGVQVVPLILLLSVEDEAAQSPRFTFAHDQQLGVVSFIHYTISYTK